MALKRHLLLGLVLTILLAACGQKGDLYLPDSSAEQTREKTP